MKSLSSKTYQCGVTIQGLTTLSGTVYLTGITNTASWDHVIVGTTAQGQIYTRTYAQFMGDVATGISLSSYVTGSGTTNYLPKFTGGSALGNSQIFDNGTNVGIGLTNPDYPLTVTSINVGDAGANLGIILNSVINSAIPSSSVKAIIGVTNSGFGFPAGSLLIQPRTGVGGVTAFATEGTEKMRITSGGNVGIGTTSPGYKLNVYESNTAESVSAKFQTTHPNLNYILLQNGGGSFNHYIQTNSGTLGLSADENGSSGVIQLKTNNVIAVTVNTSQNVGIGTTSPSSRLQVAGLAIITNSSGSSYNENLRLPESGGGYASIVMGGAVATSGTGATVWSLLKHPSGNGHRFSIRNNNTEHFNIFTNGNVAINTTTDAGYKLDVNGTFRSNALWTTSSSIVEWGLQPSAYGVLTWDTGYARIHATSGNRLDLGASGGLHMTISTSGNVGIGTTSPDTKLHVWNGDSGGAPYEATGITIENSGRAALNFLSGAGNDAYVFFGNSSSGNAGYVGYENTANRLVLRSSDYISLLDSTGEVIRIDNGNVGIGTTTPGAELVVNSANNNTRVFIQNAGSTKLEVGYGPTGYGFTHPTGEFIGHSDNLYFGQISSVSTNVTFTTGGNVGIGTTSPLTTLNVQKATNTELSLTYTTNSGANYSQISGGSINLTNKWATIQFKQDASEDAHHILFSTANPSTNTTERMRITSGGNVGIGMSPASNERFSVNAAEGVWALSAYRSGVQIGGIHLNDSILNIQGAGGSEVRLSTTGNATWNGDILATRAWVGSQGYLTSVSDVWVNTSGDTMTGALTIQGGWATTILDGDNVVLRKPNYSAGGWARTLLNFQEYDTTSLFQIGGYGSNNTMSYGYLGSAYNTPTFRWYADKRVIFDGSVGIGTDSPAAKFHVHGYTTIDSVDVVATFSSDNTAKRVNIGYSTSGDYGFINAVHTGVAWKNLIFGVNGGNVGIGTTSPSTKFVVSNAGASGFEVDPTGGVGSGVLLQAYNRSTSAYMAQSYYALSHTFNVGSGAATRAVDITSAGNVGIGTTSPGFKLEVNGGATGNNIARFTTGGVGGGTRGLTMYSDNSQVKLQVSDNAGGIGTWAFLNLNPDGGYVGIGTTSPSTTLTVNGIITATGGNSTQWNTAYGWGNHASASYVPQARTLTINGTSYDLSANRTWTISAATPGGSDTQFQYNSSGSLAGASALTYNSTTNRVGINQASPGYDLDVNGQVRVQDKLRVGTVNSGNGVVHMSSTATINASATTIVWAQNVSVGMCAFIEYYILNSNSLTDQRAGTIIVTWNQSGTPTITHTETTTPDIGSTIAVNFTSSLVGSDARINAVNSSANPYTMVMSYKYF